MFLEAQGHCNLLLANFAHRVTEAMSVVVDVGLMSGKTVSVETSLDELVATLKRRAQTALAVGTGRLLDCFGGPLDGMLTVKEAKLETRTSLMLQLRRVQVQASFTAFAAILPDGPAVRWGKDDYGGDSRSVQDQLQGVQQIQASRSPCGGAFAAILTDGSVVTWGDEDYGGDSRSVRDQLKDVQQIQASSAAFAAILTDGSVVTWGDNGFGGDSPSVQDQLKDVQQIQACSAAFAAILTDGSVVTWGKDGLGGDSRSVQDQRQGVQQIQASRSPCGGAFAAILTDGSVVTWGDEDYGGDSRAVQD